MAKKRAKPKSKKEALAVAVAPIIAKGCTVQEVENLIHAAEQAFRFGSSVIWSDIYEVLDSEAEKALATTPKQV